MDLNRYLRVIINNKIRPLFLKDKCEICQLEDNLNLHHVRLFSEIVNETLHELNLSYKDSNDYTKIKLDIITNIILGKHIQIEYITLCYQCHKEEHREEWSRITINNKHKEFYIKQKEKKELAETLRIENIIIPYLNKNKDKRITIKSKEQQDLISLIDFKEDGKQRKSYASINKFFKENGIPFIIESNRTTGNYNYWIIKEVKL